ARGRGGAPPRAWRRVLPSLALTSEIDAVAQLPGHIAGEEPPLAHARRRIAGHRVYEHPDSRGEPRIPALGQNARDRPGEHIPHAGSRHTGIAALAEGRYAPRRADQRAGAFENDGAAIPCD